MTAREAILAAIRAAAVPAAPAVDHAWERPADGASVAMFVRTLESVGGQAIVAERGASLPAVLERIAAEAGHPVEAVRGRLAVAENGAVLVDATDLAARTDVVLPEHLVLVVPATAIVATMHEAVRRLPVAAGCWWFLSGPSKTADIERALVIGAQGARWLTVVLMTE